MYRPIKLPLGGPSIRYWPPGRLWHVVKWDAVREFWKPQRVFAFDEDL